MADRWSILLQTVQDHKCARLPEIPFLAKKHSTTFLNSLIHDQAPFVGIKCWADHPMSQNTTISTPASITKVSGSKDIAAHPSLHPTIRLSKRNQPELSIASVVPLDTNNERLYSLANVSETLQSIPARMTRKRTADTAYVVEEEEQPHKSGAASKPEDNPQPSIETIEKICLCQPDPKIPRPRNGMSQRLPT